MHTEVYQNRELSWLKFNERVLEEAEREENPLCERLSFASIYQSNLDEFFMVRCGSLVDQLSLKHPPADNKTNMSPKEQLRAVLSRVAQLSDRKDRVYQRLMEELAGEGVRLVDFHRLDSEESAKLERYFDRELAPLLSPIVVGKRHPFPFLRNLEIYAVGVLESRRGKRRLGLIPCGSGVFPRLIQVGPERGTYMLSEELILHFLPKVFSEFHVAAKSLIRVTRNADIDADALYDEDLDYREFMADLMKKRRRLAPIRLELSRELGRDIVDDLCGYMDISRWSVFRSAIPLELSFLSQLQDSLRQESRLFYPRRIPQRSAQFREDAPILEQVDEKDKLLAYPFDSMKPFLRLLREAAADREVVSIRMTLYRVARHSEIVEYLIEAAENGKDVLVLVELKARFDEENNIEWSRQLEEAGCTVIYGLNGYKVHSKLCLITRRTAAGVRYSTQIGTGNYNEKTARAYTDFSLLTADQELGREAASVFQALAMGGTVRHCERLMVAPHCLQNKILDKMDQEIRHAALGEPGYIGAKLNSLTDKRIIDKLIEASQAGVQIELVIRGICCLLPGVPGKTENIRVVSIVGRFLEHSRLYFFGPEERGEIYLSSADWMTRNTLRRVEVAAPVDDPQLKAQLRFMFRILLRDNRQARELGPDGLYRPVPRTEPPVNAQELFYDLAYLQAKLPRERLLARVKELETELLAPPVPPQSAAAKQPVTEQQPATEEADSQGPATFRGAEE